MKPVTRLITFALLCGAAHLGFASIATAQDFPSRDINFIVPSSAGGGSDIIARTVANIIAQHDLMPVQVMVENRVGGSGVVGYTYIANRAGDPHVAGPISGSFFTTALAGESTVSYRDFTPLAAIAEDPFVIVVRSDSGIETMDDLIAAGEVDVGSTGVLTDHALLAARLEDKTGLDTTVVPFNGDGEVLAAMLGGHIDVQIGNPSEVLAQVEAGRLTPLAVTTAQRTSAFPDVPTLSELGIDIVHGQLRSFVMPGGLDPQDVAYMEAVFERVASSPEWETEYLQRNHAIPLFLGSEELAARFVEMDAMYSEFMKEIGLID